MSGELSSYSEIIGEEARHFGETDNQYNRDVSWGVLPVFWHEVGKRVDIAGTAAEHLRGRDHPVGLTLACGDMHGEYRMLKNAGAKEIDAFDISEGQRDKFFRNVYDGAVRVNYEICDVNQISLDRKRYDVVFVLQAYHHVERLEHVADEIRASLKDDGIFVLIDYVGANFLQRTPRQRDLCGAIWRTMPERYRIARNGRVVNELRIPDKDSLSPYEAIRSEEILSVLESRFETRDAFLYGGILMPLFNGFANNYTDSPDDLMFQKIMWQLDRWLIQTGRIEPNFIRAIFVPRASVIPIQPAVAAAAPAVPQVAASPVAPSPRRPPRDIENEPARRAENAVDGVRFAATTRAASRRLTARALRACKRHIASHVSQRFVRLTYHDSAAGSPRHAVLDVVHYDRGRGEVIVVDLASRRPRWFRSIREDPNVEIEIGGRRISATACRLSEAEAASALLAYERHRRLVRSVNRRVLAARLGWRYDGSAKSRHRLAREARIMMFREHD